MEWDLKKIRESLVRDLVNKLRIRARICVTNVMCEWWAQLE